MPIGARRFVSWALAAIVVAGAATFDRPAFALAPPASATTARQEPTATETPPAESPAPAEVMSPVPASPGAVAPEAPGPAASSPEPAVGQVTAIGLFPDLSIASVQN